MEAHSDDDENDDDDVVSDSIGDTEVVVSPLELGNNDIFAINAVKIGAELVELKTDTTKMEESSGHNEGGHTVQVSVDDATVYIPFHDGWSPQIPGWSGLSNARVTIFGDVFPLPEDQQEWAHQQYIAKHHQGPSQKWGNFYYLRLQNISDIYFIGGFGTVAWVNVSEYEALRPDKIAVDGGEQMLKELNAIFSKPIKELLSLETEFNIQRLAFKEGHMGLKLSRKPKRYCGT